MERTPPVGVKWHEYANLFPWLNAAARAELKADIEKNGVLDPIVFIGEYVLDGRNRYEIARELGIEYPRVEYEGDDPLGFVLSKNLTRRHLTDRERADVAAKLAKLPKGANQHSSIETPSIERAAEIMDVPVAAVKRAKEIADHAGPELQAAYQSGKVSQSAAAEVARLPKKAQAKAVADGAVAAKAKEQKEKRAAERKAEQAKNEAHREESRAALPAGIQAIEQAKAKARGKSDETDLPAEDRIAELEEANRVLEAENADLKARIKKFSEMEVEYQKGGFAEVIAGKDEVISTLKTRVERESADKVSWKKSSDMWRARAEEAGWSNDIAIDIETGAVVNA